MAQNKLYIEDPAIWEKLSTQQKVRWLILQESHFGHNPCESCMNYSEGCTCKEEPNFV